MQLIRFVKEWMLIFAILAGILAYFIFVNIPFFASMRAEAARALAIVQPTLIFAMLFLTFCKIDLRQLKPRRWHAWILALQTGLFVLTGAILIAMPHSGLRVVLEGAMLCIICPTATASAVITRKLGGDVSGITTYLILINIAVAILIPLMVPLVHPNPELNMARASLLILAKVFPLLLLPLLIALVLRKTAPAAVERLARFQNLSFYLWAIALALAMTVTTRSMVHATVDLHTQLWLVAVSLACCLLQFWLGRHIGGIYGDKITAGQSFGQKNTVLAIWMGYTFFTPVTALVGGFYSVWHNVINSWQLHRAQTAARPAPAKAD